MAKATPCTVLAAFLAVGLLSGCSISASLNSSVGAVGGIFKGIGNGFKWSSETVSSGATPAVASSYRRDVRAYTVAYLSQGSIEEEFTRGVGRIAETHGITDWEASPDTAQAIGEVIRRGDLSELEAQRLRAELAGLQTLESIFAETEH